MPPEADPPLEFARPLALGLVGPAGREEVLRATPAECAALARRFDLLALDRLEARLRLTPEADGAILARGQMEAELVQECVVTLEPVRQTVAEPVALRLLPPGREPEDGPEDLDEVACPGGIAELGEAVAEQLSLAIDPYPRAAGAELPEVASDPSANPFAALTALRRPR